MQLQKIGGIIRDQKIKIFLSNHGWTTIPRILVKGFKRKGIRESRQRAGCEGSSAHVETEEDEQGRQGEKEKMIPFSVVIWAVNCKRLTDLKCKIKKLIPKMQLGNLPMLGLGTRLLRRPIWR